MSARDTTKATPRSIAVAILFFLLMCGAWILFVAGLKLHEMIAGAGSVLAAGIFLLAVHETSALNLSFHLTDIVACWRLPWYILSGVYEITIILLKDLFGIERAKSFFRVSGFKTSKKDPVLAARRVLATAYTTVAPNFIVIGIDYTQSRMLFHQLERSSVPKMTKSLGAES